MIGSKYEIEKIPLPSYIDSEKLEEFNCGVKKIDDFLINKAEEVQQGGIASTTLFINAESNKIMAFYTTHVAMTIVKVAGMSQTKDLACINLAYFAIDKEFQGLTVGRQLIKNLLTELIYISQSIGFSAVTVESLPDTFEFYEKCGFEETIPGTYTNHDLKTYNLFIPFNKLFDNI